MTRRPAALSVRIVGLAFQAGLEAETTFATARALERSARCWALVPPEDAEAIRGLAPMFGDSALLLAPTEPKSAVETACFLLAGLDPGPVAVLLAGLPSRRSFGRFGQNAESRLTACRPDLQVHHHTVDWSRRLPRIR